MASAWPAIEDALSDAVDAAFAEDLEFRPMVALPNARPAADPDRSERDVTGVFDEKASQIEAEGAGLYELGRVSHGLSTQKPLASIDVRQFADGELPRRLDRIKRTATADVYEIAEVEPDGQGRLRLMLKHVVKES